VAKFLYFFSVNWRDLPLVHSIESDQVGIEAAFSRLPQRKLLVSILLT